MQPLHQQEFGQKQKKVETFQEFDYDAELTEEEKAILKKSFHSADFDNNKFLSETEISMAINRETKQHITVTFRYVASSVDCNYCFVAESHEEQFQSVFLA